MTPLAKASLQWFADHSPVGWFDLASPSRAMLRKFEKAGLIEALPTPKNGVHVVKYQITETGRRALTK